MKFIRPITIGDAQFISSSEPETDYAAWSSVTAYAVGGHCVRGHRRWEAVLANTNKDPLVAANSANWLDLGPTNQRAMLDKVVGTRTVSTGTPAPGDPHQIVLEVLPGVCDSIAVLDINAYHTQVDIVQESVVVHTVFQNTGDTATITNWFEYFTEPIIPRTRAIFENLPTYPSAHYRVTLTHPNEPVSCGTSVFGRMFNLGLTQYGATLGITDYSKKKADPDFGTIDVQERDFAKRMSVKVEIPNAMLDTIDRELSAIRATPVVWIGASMYDALIAYGFYKDWQIEIPYYSHSFCSIQIEGLT